MDNLSTRYLTKSKFIAGLQCELRLWNQIYRPLPREESLPGTPQYEGTRIGALARQLFPAGVLVNNGPEDHKGALERTRRLIADNCPAIFEGAFEYNNRRIRADVLSRASEGEWFLYEVKSSTSVHDDHYLDAAFQADVLRRSGVDLHSIHIIHVNSDYRLGPDGLDLSDFFSFVDVSGVLSENQEELGTNLANLTRVVRGAEPPKVAPGLHCRRPYACEYIPDCWASLPHDWVGKLPRLTNDLREKLARASIDSIAEIPPGFSLGCLHESMRRAYSTGTPTVAENIREILRPLGPPAFYLDFESLMPGIPLYLGTGPYQHIPFLFSLHSDHRGMLTHTDYIAPPGEDPRPGLVEALIRQTASAEGPIIVYSPYEKRILKELALDLPAFAAGLHGIVARLQDLHAIVRKSVYFPGFNGSFSLKSVAPVLAANLDYSDLSIKDGSTAAACYQRLVEQPEIPAHEAKTALSDIRSYCERDTLAAVSYTHLTLPTTPYV